MERSLDILHLSLHGLIRGRELELGRDPDTGGQCLYVLELVKALAEHPDIHRTTLVTRRVYDQKIAPEYSAAFEALGPKADIRRIEAGPRRYLRKEALWRHLDAFIDGILTWLRRERRVPDLIHAHYADAGYVGRQVAAVLGVPFIFTGHSLGRVKLARLIEGGADSGELERRYNMRARIEAEELSLDAAAWVCTSTRQEVEEQYALYHQYAADRMRVIPPGVDLSRFDGAGDAAAQASVAAMMDRFLRDPGKPPVMAIARADERKNLAGLLRAFGSNPWLRAHANLVIIGGNRDSIDQLPSGGRKVWLELLRLIDDYDLHGICAIPKRHSAAEVPEFYRWAAARSGVFVNAAFTEPFGLTLLEAAAAGLPLVATHDGGPQDILACCRNGELVNPLDEGAIGDATEAILRQPATHKMLSENGMKLVRRHYSWSGHVERYLEELAKVLPARKPPLSGPRALLPNCPRWVVMPLPPGLEKEPPETLDRLRALVADPELGFGIATRLSYPEVVTTMNVLGLPHPTFVITGLGAEIRYGETGARDERWERQIRAGWQPDAIAAALSDTPGLVPVENPHHPLVITYERGKRGTPTRRRIQRVLRQAGLSAKVLVSSGNLIDIIPIRSGKDVALRYITHQWGIEPAHLFYFACYGNDGAVVRGRNLAAIAASADSQLKLFRPRPRLWHCQQPGLAGLFEGIDHYGFLQGAPPPPPEDSPDEEMPVDELMP